MRGCCASSDRARAAQSSSIARPLAEREWPSGSSSASVTNTVSAARPYRISGLGREGRGDGLGDALAGKAGLKDDPDATEHAMRLGRRRRGDHDRRRAYGGEGSCGNDDNNTGEYNGLHDAPRHGRGDRAKEEVRRRLATARENGAVQNAKQALTEARGR